MFGSKLPDSARVLLGISGDVGEFFCGDDLANVFQKVSGKTFLTPSVKSSDSIGCVPSACGLQIGLSVHEQVLVRFEVDSGLGVARR